MTQFNDDQEVRVYVYSPGPIAKASDWRKAKIVYQVSAKGFPCGDGFDGDSYRVQFPDGSRAVFNEAHIRAVEPRDEAHGWFCAEPSDRVRGLY